MAWVPVRRCDGRSPHRAIPSRLHCLITLGMCTDPRVVPAAIRALVESLVEAVRVEDHPRMRFLLDDLAQGLSRKRSPGDGGALPHDRASRVQKRQPVVLQVVPHAFTVGQAFPYRPVEVEEVRAGRVVHRQRELDADEPLCNPQSVHDVSGREEPGVRVLPLGRPTKRGTFGLGPHLDEPLQQRQPFRAPGLRVAGVITASEPSWIAPFTGLRPRQFGKLVTVLRREGADAVRKGRPWGLPLEDRVLLVATYWRTNLTMCQLAPLFGVSKRS